MTLDDDAFDARWDAAWRLRRTDALGALTAAQELAARLGPAATQDPEHREIGRAHV